MKCLLSPDNSSNKMKKYKYAPLKNMFVLTFVHNIVQITGKPTLKSDKRFLNRKSITCNLTKYKSPYDSTFLKI